MLLHGDLPWTSPIGDGFFSLFGLFSMCTYHLHMLLHGDLPWTSPIGDGFLAFLDYLVRVLIICICYCTVIYPGPHLLGMVFFSLFGLFSMCTYHLHMLLHGDLPWTSPIGDGFF